MNAHHIIFSALCFLLSSCAQPKNEVEIKGIYGYLGGKHGDVRMDEDGQVRLDGEIIDGWQADCKVSVNITTVLAPQKTEAPREALTWGATINSSTLTGVMGHLGKDPDQDNYLYTGVEYYKVNNGSLKFIEDLFMEQCLEPYRSIPLGEE